MVLAIAIAMAIVKGSRAPAATDGGWLGTVGLASAGGYGARGWCWRPSR